jgi:hypothetical protein
MSERQVQSARVKVLDPLVVQQVAAGEVVDRPASVIKELVENALDADASSIEIELKEGARARMAVHDDRRGMVEEDARTAVLSHATSKIATVEDLHSVSTLGFRGEALPSIASVASFELTTSTGEGAATKVSVDGGSEATVSAASRPRGTSVVVERLFYNVPARREFLKSKKVERAAVNEVFTHLALAHARPEDGALRTGIAVATLSRLVSFGHPDNDPVDLIFAFCSPDKDQHVGLLSKLTERIASGLDGRLRDARSAAEADAILEEDLGDTA